MLDIGLLKKKFNAGSKIIKNMFRWCLFIFLGEKRGKANLYTIQPDHIKDKHQ